MDSEVLETPRPAGRMLLVDGLRGLAAMAIVLPHAWVLFAEPIRQRGWTNTLVFGGRIYATLAVQVFFVLSGFVIACTLRELRVTPAVFGRFILRRSIRLDPPYWFSLIICLGVTVLLGGWHALPANRVIVAHIFYLQDIFGFGEPINHIFWTLCIEIQMYIFFSGMIGLLQAMRLNYRLVLTAALIPALGWPLGFLPSPLIRFFPASEYCFLAGAVAWWSIERSLPRWLLLLTAGSFIVAGAWHFDCNIWVVFSTAMLLVIAGKLGTLNRWLAGRIWQFLGAVSYGLYLMHQPVCDIAEATQKRLGLTSTSAGLVLLMSVYGISIALAYVLRMLVELPSIRLSHRFKVRAA